MKKFRIWIDGSAYQGINLDQTYECEASMSWVSFHNYNNASYNHPLLLAEQEPKTYSGRLGLESAVSEILLCIDHGVSEVSTIHIEVSE